MIRTLMGAVVATAVLATSAGAGEVYVSQTADTTAGAVYVQQVPLNARPKAASRSTRPQFVEKDLIEQSTGDGAERSAGEIAIIPFEGATPRLPNVGAGSQVSLLDSAAQAVFPSVAVEQAGSQDEETSSIN